MRQQWKLLLSLGRWGLWLIAKIPFLVAVGVAAWQAARLNWSSLPLEITVQAIFIMVSGWLTSEGLEVIFNRWQERIQIDQIKTGLEQFESRLDRKMELLQSQWGIPIWGRERIVLELEKAISRESAERKELLVTHMLTDPDVASIHERLESLIGIGKWNHLHLWGVNAITLQDLQTFVQKHQDKGDVGCLVKCLLIETNIWGLELILVGRSEAFVIMPIGQLPNDGLVAYNIRGDRMIEPLVRLWDKSWGDGKWIRSKEKGVVQENLEQIRRSVSPPVLVTEAQSPVQEYSEPEFWQELTNSLRNLPAAPSSSAVDEIRIRSEVCLEKYTECDAIIAKAVKTGQVRRYRRGEIVGTLEEFESLSKFIEVGGRILNIFVSTDRCGKEHIKPWSFWIIRPTNLVFLRIPESSRLLSSSGFLVIRDRSLVNAFMAYFDDWWANKPQQTLRTSGLICDSGTIEGVFLGTLRRELSG